MGLVEKISFLTRRMLLQLGRGKLGYLFNVECGKMHRNSTKKEVREQYLQGLNSTMEIGPSMAQIWREHSGALAYRD